MTQSPEAAAQPAHEAAYEQVFQEHFERMARIAERRGAGNDGEDVAQEAFLRLWRQGEAFSYDDNPGAWLGLATRRIMVDRYRYQQSRVPEVPTDDLEFGFSAPDQPEREVVTKALVALALGLMSAKQRVVCEQVYLGDATFDDVAAKIGISPNTARTRGYYGLLTARKALKELGITSSTE